MADPQTHFTIVMEVSRVEPEQTVSSGYNNKDEKVVPRRVHEVARVVLRGDSVTKLYTTATKHLDILRETEGAD